MNETIANNAEPRPTVRCIECDTEVEHYVTFVMPSNEMRNVCWSCQDREDKGFNMKPEYRRERSGGRFLPRSPKFD
ncbi:MAG: hypothetical protein LC768_16770 [Acidobacteria bacterium]|nr:hypothetical protein [Acidobacteriota bacterium]MCA1639953.1 hypothetical protein [Acidobacteriota bacterium]